MTGLTLLLRLLLVVVLALAAYVDRIYSEMGKFLAREYQDNIDSWEQEVEPRLRLDRESIAQAASVLRQLSLAACALLFGLHLMSPASAYPVSTYPGWRETLVAVFELILLILIFDRLLPQVLFARTRGLWVRRLRYVFQALFYLVLPVTLLLGLLLSIAALAEPGDAEQPEHPSEAMDALLEAGEEEGILEESDRELVRSVVEFGDKVVREVMTPRPEVFAVPATMTLREFTDAIEEHPFSRVPVYRGSLDEITGIAFAHDLLQVTDEDAVTRTVAEIERPAAFVPESKPVAPLLREMQSEKQHMRLVIDEYGAVAGVVTIEDLLEAIVGSIADEHDVAEDTNDAIPDGEGRWLVSGTFELSRLRELFAEPAALPQQTLDDEDSEGRPAPEPTEPVPAREDSAREEPAAALRLPEHYESTTVGGLVSELAGHIPLPGEVVEESGLRLEVVASTDRRIDRIRVSQTQTEA